jgi:hypothetical protein
MLKLKSFLLAAASVLALGAPVLAASKPANKEVLLTPEHLSGGVVHNDGYYLPRSLIIPAQLHTPIDTRSNKVGDIVTMQTTQDLYISDYNIIPAQSFLHGYISRLEKPGRLYKTPKVNVTFDTASLPGSSERRQIRIRGEIREKEILKNSKKVNNAMGFKSKAALAGGVGAVGAGTGAYIALGNIASLASKASVAGAVIGGAALGASLVSRDDIRINPGTELDIILEESSVDNFPMDHPLSRTKEIDRDLLKPENYDSFTEDIYPFTL